MIANTRVIVVAATIAVMATLAAVEESQAQKWNYRDSAVYRFYYLEGSLSGKSLAETLVKSESFRYSDGAYLTAWTNIGTPGDLYKLFADTRGLIPVYLESDTKYNNQYRSAYNVSGFNGQWLWLGAGGPNSNFLQGLTWSAASLSKVGTLLCYETSRLVFTNAVGIFQSAYPLPANPGFSSPSQMAKYNLFREALANYCALSAYACGPQHNFGSIKALAKLCFGNLSWQQIWNYASVPGNSVASLAVGYYLAKHKGYGKTLTLVKNIRDFYAKSPAADPFKPAVQATYGYTFDGSAYSSNSGSLSEHFRRYYLGI